MRSAERGPCMRSKHTSPSVRTCLARLSSLIVTMMNACVRLSLTHATQPVQLYHEQVLVGGERLLDTCRRRTIALIVLLLLTFVSDRTISNSQDVLSAETDHWIHSTHTNDYYKDKSNPMFGEYSFWLITKAGVNLTKPPDLRAYSSRCAC